MAAQNASAAMSVLEAELAIDTLDAELAMGTLISEPAVDLLAVLGEPPLPEHLQDRLAVASELAVQPELLESASHGAPFARIAVRVHRYLDQECLCPSCRTLAACEDLTTQSQTAALH